MSWDAKIVCAVGSICINDAGGFVSKLHCEGKHTSYICSTMMKDASAPVKNWR